jgi:hypothetical protein
MARLVRRLALGRFAPDWPALGRFAPGSFALDIVVGMSAIVYKSQTTGVKRAIPGRTAERPHR